MDAQPTMSAAVDPEMAEILRVQQASPAPDFEHMDLAEARELFQRNAAAWNTPLPDVPASDTAVGGVPCRLFSPAGMLQGQRLIVFVHGGGWTFGSPASHDRFARMIASQSHVQVLSVDYRLAPEHACPAAIDDVVRVLDGHGLTGPVALCGDSAGANIAIAAALQRPVAALALLYGCFAPIFDTDSHRRRGDGRFGITTDRMRWYWENWLGAAQDPLAAPLHADLRGLPRTHLVAAGLDPLCDDSVLMAGRLAAHDVPCRLDIVPGVIHGFLQMSARLSPARRALGLIVQELETALGVPA